MKLRLLALALTVTNFAFAQFSNYRYIPHYDVPKSPSASAFERYTTVPANYQSGQVNPTIPLMSFSVDNITVPLTLIYSSTGLKLTDVANWVGEGWMLQVGGTITRQIRGIPDDNAASGLMNSYIATELNNFLTDARNGNNTLMSWTDKLAYFKSITRQFTDSQHDVFYYDVLGVKGAFYINSASKCVQFPKSNNVITFTTNPTSGNITTFTVKDENGNTYNFGIKEETVNTSTSNPTEVDNYYNSLVGDSWYLTSIQTKNFQTITFNYNQYHYSKREESQTEGFTSGSISCFTSGGGRVTTIMTNTVPVYQLSSITWSGGLINFNASGSNRTDIIAFDPTAAVPSLASIIMYHQNSAATGGASTLVQNVSFDYDQTPRLLLRNLHVNGNGDGSALPANYSFNYNNTSNIPAYPTVNTNAYCAQDYWGYYNGVSSNASMLPYDTYYNLVGFNVINSYSGTINRTPNPIYESAGMLQEIIYPTGGKAKFTYEPNVINKSFYGGDHFVATLPTTTDAQGTVWATFGGMRINKVEFYTTASSPTPSTTTTIKYGGGQTRALPNYASYLTSNYLQDHINSGVCDVCNGSQLLTIHSSSVINDPFPVIEYGQVTEYAGTDNNSGQTVHTYNATQIGAGSSSSNVPYPIPQLLNYTAYESNTASQLPNGTTVMEKASSFTGNDIVPSPDNDMDLTVCLVQSDDCINYNYVDRNPVNDADAATLYANCFRFGLNPLSSSSFLPAWQYQKTYTSSGQIITDQSTDNYNLSQKNLLLPNSISKINSKGETEKTLIKYPQDYFAGAAVSTADPVINGLVELISNNMLNVPIEQITIVNRGGLDYVTGGIITTFYSDKTEASQTYKLEITQPVQLSAFTTSYQNAGGVFVYDSRYKLDKQFYAYTSNNQLQEFTDRPGGRRNSIIWGYLQPVPIAEITGPPLASQSLSINDIAYTSFELDADGGWAIPSTSRSLVPHISPKTGIQFYNLSSGDVTKSGLTASTIYTVCYWTRNALPFVITGTVGAAVQGQTTSGWTFYTHRVTGQNTISLSGSGYIDELRLYPESSQMKSYTYDPLVGITSTTDANNVTTYYQYDALHRLEGVWDKDRNIIKYINYHYKQ